MILKPEECKQLARVTGDKIIEDQRNVIKVPRAKIYEAIESALSQHFEEERRIEQRAEKLLQERKAEFEGIQHGKAFHMIKKQIAQEEDFIMSGGNEGRMSADKISHIAHLAADKLYDDDLMDFPDEDDGPKEVKKIFNQYFQQEDALDQKVRQKIQSQSNAPFEGSKDWEVLYRKYYEEEMKRLGRG